MSLLSWNDLTDPIMSVSAVWFSFIDNVSYKRFKLFDSEVLNQDLQYLDQVVHENLYVQKEVGHAWYFNALDTYLINISCFILFKMQLVILPQSTQGDGKSWIHC